MSKNNFILIIFLNLFLIGNTGNNYYTNQRSTSSIGGNSGGGNGGLGRNSFGKYGQYYGNNNNNNELEEWNNEKEQRLLLKHSEITSASFISEDYCIERCQISCSSSFVYISRDKDPQIQFNCLKLKPPERKLHEKLVASITSASFFEFFIAGIIILSIGICCLCSCYQCFCKNPQIIHRNRGRHCVVENDNKNIPPDGIITSFNGTGGTTSTGVSPEHDPLVNEKIPHIDEGIQSAPFISNNNGGSGIGFNHHHQHNLNQHHYIKTTNNSFNKNCGGEHSIV